MGINQQFIAACKNGDMHQVLYLLHRRRMLGLQAPDINYRGHGYTGCMWASRKGHYDIVMYLINHGQGSLEIDAQCRYGDTALHFACHQNHYDIAALLLGNGADPTIDGGMNGHVLLNMCRVKYGDRVAKMTVDENKKIIELLLLFGADINQVSNLSMRIPSTCLVNAYLFRDVDFFKYILDKTDDMCIATSKYIIQQCNWYDPMNADNVEKFQIVEDLYN